MSPSSVISSIFDHHRVYKPVKVIIEGIGYQRTLKHWLELKQRKLNQYFYIEVIKSHTLSKADRVRGLQPFFAAHKVFLKPGMDELERELLAFPKGAHDDVVDTLALQLEAWNTSTTLAAQDKADRLSRNPFAVDVLLKDIADRQNRPYQYPYDMGNMRHRLRPFPHSTTSTSTTRKAWR